MRFFLFLAIAATGLGHDMMMVSAAHQQSHDLVSTAKWVSQAVLDSTSNNHHRSLQTTSDDCTTVFSDYFNCLLTNCAEASCETDPATGEEGSTDPCANFEETYCNAFDGTCCPACESQMIPYRECLFQSSVYLICPGQSCVDGGGGGGGSDSGTPTNDSGSDSEGSGTPTNPPATDSTGSGSSSVQTDTETDTGGLFGDVGICETETNALETCGNEKCAPCLDGLEEEEEAVDATSTEFNFDCDDIQGTLCNGVKSFKDCCSACASEASAVESCTINLLSSTLCPTATSCDGSSGSGSSGPNFFAANTWNFLVVSVLGAFVGRAFFMI